MGTIPNGLVMIGTGSSRWLAKCKTPPLVGSAGGYFGVDLLVSATTIDLS